MCGIVGTFNFRSGARVDPQVIHAMATLIRHRGPDADGFYVDGPLGLGHRRLSILDLSDRGRQPLATPDGRFVIVYNGEVYNYLELRAELEGRGWLFRTNTDTEVVLALYAEEGKDCLRRLNGMFAFAIWDSVARTLFLARDRIGIKPLYYVQTHDGIIFASEAKALFLDPRVECEVAEPLIGTYMAFGYVPGEETLFRGVRKLLPAHFATIDASGFRTGCYWDVAYRPEPTRTVEETAEELRALLLDAVRIHLRSDVPVGVFLSGGLDSSTVVALLAESGIPRIKTFAVAYDEGAGYDETPYARLVADRFQTDHHILRLDANLFAGFIPDYVWQMDEPVTEAAAISLYFVAKLLREHVVVALAGEGADELFAGYQVYRYMRWLELYRRAPDWLRLTLSDPLLMRVGTPKVQKYVRLSRLPLEARYRGVSLPDSAEAESLYTDEFSELLSARSASAPLAGYYERTAGQDTLTRLLYADLKTWLVDDLLVKADKMTMANSVELRVPFLDYRVVEYAATIPSWMKLRRGTVKWILKRAMKRHLPEEVLTRTKVGFPTPLAIMFRRDLTGYLHDVLLARQSIERGYFKPQRVRQLIDEHESGKRDHHKLLWQLTVLEEWHRRFARRVSVAA